MFGGLPGLEWLRAVKLYTILGADVYLIPTIIALGFAAYVIFLNFRGASSAAKLQAFLTKALLCGMLLAMGISIFTGSPDNAMPVFLAGHQRRWRRACNHLHQPLCRYCFGARAHARSSTRALTPFPSRLRRRPRVSTGNKFGKVISLALLAAGGFYMVCIYSFGTILPWHDFVEQPVPALARLKNINMILYVIMLCIATLGPHGPHEQLSTAPRAASCSPWVARVSCLSPLPRWTRSPVRPSSPAWCLRSSRWWAPFLGKNMLIPLTNVSALAFIFSCTMVSFACLRMRFTEPDLPRPYKVPGGKFWHRAGLSRRLHHHRPACAALQSSLRSGRSVEWAIVIGWLVVGLGAHGGHQGPRIKAPSHRGQQPCSRNIQQTHR